MVDLKTRQTIAEDTIARSPSIADSTPGGTLASTFMPSQLPPLQASSSPRLTRGPIRVLNTDSFAAARSLLSSNPHTRVAVLNLASDEHPGGGWRYALSKTQEEALCYSSTLFATLKEEWYPWLNTGPGSTAGVYSPGVVVFRDTLDGGLVEFAEGERVVVSVITVAAPRGPLLAEGEDGRHVFARKSDLDDMREKIRLVYRCAGHNGRTSLVLGAMGCGAYGCPQEVVAREMRTILEDREFDGWFENVVFAVYAAGEVGRQNLRVFQREFASEA